MKQYLDLLRHIQEKGEKKSDRTGTGTQSIFGYQLRIDLAQRFPLLTTKKIHIPSLVHELLWFLKGQTNIGYLKEHKVSIWDAWADKDRNLGPIYGAQWRSWPDHCSGTKIDQIAQVIEQIKNNPDSRRLVVSAWNVADIPSMALPPCHVLFQFYVTGEEGPDKKKRLSCQLYQRSADVFLGVPFNIASYSLLTCMVAKVCKLEPGEFIHTFGDVHLYDNHQEQAEKQLARQPKDLPSLIIDPNIDSIDDFSYKSFDFKNYHPHPTITAKVAV